MQELREIVARAARGRAVGERLVLATLVSVRGSHYRKPGARMLLAPDRPVGEATGVLSGGCLEGDLAERARRVAARGEPEIAEYDLSRSGDALWGFGLGCSGVVTILVEPLAVEATAGSLAFVERCLLRRERGALATLFAGEPTADADRRTPGRWWALDRAGTTSGDLDPTLAGELAPALRAALDGAPAQVVEVERANGRASLLVEPIAPPVSFVIGGAGRDAVAMAQAARSLGWEVTLVDPQALDDTAARFAGVDHLVAGPLHGLARRLFLGPRAAAVVMTHRYLDDLALLEELLPLGFDYLGLLGPRARRERLLGDLASRGSAPTPAQRACLFGPAGLDLGSEGPTEIAVAVIAEALAVLSRREARSLAAVADTIAAQGLVPAAG
ncbi:MAG: XdhC family protein [Holophagales bacterium]|nr:MAG: XdhC family protein [Holophagales bacterium]